MEARNFFVQSYEIILIHLSISTRWEYYSFCVPDAFVDTCTTLPTIYDTTGSLRTENLLIRSKDIRRLLLYKKRLSFVIKMFLFVCRTIFLEEVVFETALTGTNRVLHTYNRKNLAACIKGASSSFRNHFDGNVVHNHQNDFLRLYFWCYYYYGTFICLIFSFFKKCKLSAFLISFFQYL